MYYYVMCIAWAFRSSSALLVHTVLNVEYMNCIAYCLIRQAYKSLAAEGSQDLCKDDFMLHMIYNSCAVERLALGHSSTVSQRKADKRICRQAY